MVRVGLTGRERTVRMKKMILHMHKEACQKTHFDEAN